jgi:solute carrier family 25 protein 44
MVYMSTLERTKSFVADGTQKMGIPESTAAGITSGVAGLTASVVTQTVVVPVDVVSGQCPDLFCISADLP